VSLADRVTERLSTSRLTALTRPDSSSSTTVDTTLLGLACTDAAAEFAAYAEATYDESDAQHVTLAVQGVELVLARYAGRASSDEYQRSWERWTTACRALAATASRARISPETTSELTPSTEVEDGEERQPDFDRARFFDVIPGE
jgi:hypothetical protein